MLVTEDLHDRWDLEVGWYNGRDGCRSRLRLCEASSESCI
jgi:hypothetical protein